MISPLNLRSIDKTQLPRVTSIFSCLAYFSSHASCIARQQHNTWVVASAGDANVNPSAVHSPSGPTLAGHPTPHDPTCSLIGMQSNTFFFYLIPISAKAIYTHVNFSTPFSHWIFFYCYELIPYYTTNILTTLIHYSLLQL